MEVNALSLNSIDILLNKSSLVFNFVAKITCVKIRVTNKLLASKDRGVKGSFGNRIEYTFNPNPSEFLLFRAKTAL